MTKCQEEASVKMNELAEVTDVSENEEKDEEEEEDEDEEEEEEEEEDEEEEEEEEEMAPRPPARAGRASVFCSVTDGSGPSAMYPCLCGSVACAKNQLCHKSGTSGAEPYCQATRNDEPSSETTCAPLSLEQRSQIGIRGKWRQEACTASCGDGW